MPYDYDRTLLNVPRVRQDHDYDCGPAALQAVLAYYGFKTSLDALARLAGTTEEGTPIEGIARVAEDFGFRVVSREMTLEEVKDYLNEGTPVILNLQAWPGGPVDWNRTWDSGHYVVALGYAGNEMYFEDPWVRPRVYLTFDELSVRWHDVDSRKGIARRNQGIAIFLPA